MAHRTIPVKELIESAAKPYKELWRDGELNLNELARHYDKNGHKVSQASFSRIFRGGQGKKGHGRKFIDATNAVFRIPKNLLRGEPMSGDLEKTLMRFQYSTILLAERLEELPKDDYYAIAAQIERAEQHAKEIKEAMQSGGVVSIDKHRRK